MEKLVVCVFVVVCCFDVEMVCFVDDEYFVWKFFYDGCVGYFVDEFGKCYVLLDVDVFLYVFF